MHFINLLAFIKPHSYATHVAQWRDSVCSRFTVQSSESQQSGCESIVCLMPVLLSGPEDHSWKCWLVDGIWKALQAHKQQLET